MRLLYFDKVLTGNPVVGAGDRVGYMNCLEPEWAHHTSFSDCPAAYPCLYFNNVVTEPFEDLRRDQEGSPSLNGLTKNKVP